MIFGLLPHQLLRSLCAKGTLEWSVPEQELMFTELAFARVPEAYDVDRAASRGLWPP